MNSFFTYEIENGNIEIEYENILAKVVASHCGKDHVGLVTAVLPFPNYSQPTGLHCDEPKRTPPFSVYHTSCSPMNELPNFFITGQHFVPALKLFQRGFLHRNPSDILLITEGTSRLVSWDFQWKQEALILESNGDAHRRPSAGMQLKASF